MSSREERKPESIRTREDLALGLAGLRESAGLTVRALARKSTVPQGTVASWCAGHHIPTKANEPMFRLLLRACEVTEPAEQYEWIRAVERVRDGTGKHGGEPPYPGLRPFEAADAERFFGRAELAGRVREHVLDARGRTGPGRIVVVIGASGSGKSSLLRAGLVPDLGPDGLQVHVILPGSHPTRALSQVPDSADVIVVDQCEEAWTLCRDEAERRQFLTALSTAAPGEAVVVLGLRADYFAAAAAEPALLDALHHRSTVVGPLDRAALRSAIEGPARLAGCDVQPELVDLLLAELRPHGTEAAHDVGALPLLSHALLETWHRATRNTLTVTDYRAGGGIAGAVQQRAEEVYGALSEHERRVARRIFLRLIEVDEDSRTRRRVRAAHLRVDDEAVVAAVIDRFADGRLLTVETDMVAISHEALIGAWSRLSRWADDDRDGQILHRRLTRAAEAWEDSGRDPSTLLAAARLPLIREWLDIGDHGDELNTSEREYLTASAEHHRRLAGLERKRKRLLQCLVITLTVLLVITITAGIVATAQRAAAQRARDEAISRQLAGAAVRLRAGDPALAAQLALAAYRTNPTVEARSALLDTSATPTPVRLAGPTGNTLLTAGSTGAQLIWAADGSSARLAAGDGRPGLVPLPLPRLAAPGVAALGRGDTLFARATETSLELWDIRDPVAVRLLYRTDLPGVTSLVFAADGSGLFAGTETGAIARWNLERPDRPSALPALTLPGGRAEVTTDPTGTLLAAGGAHRALRVWRASAPDTTPLLDLPPDNSADHIQALGFSPDGATLAAAMRSAQILRWRFDGDRPPATLPALGGFTSYVTDVTFSPDGARLAAAGADNTTRVWSTADDELEASLPNPAVVTSVRFAGPGRLVTTSADGATRIWPLPGPALAPARAKIEFAPFDRAGTTLLAGPGRTDTRSYLWDLRDTRAPRLHPPLESGPDDTQTGAVALAPPGTTAAVGSTGGQVQLWTLTDPDRPQRAASIPALDSVVAALAFTPDGARLAVAGQDRTTVTLWDVADPAAPQLLSTLDTGPGQPRNLAVDDGGTLLAVSTTANLVQLWDIGDPRSPRQHPALTGFDGVVRTVAISPDGRLLAAGGDDPEVRLFDITDPAHPKRPVHLTGPVDTAYSVAFSPDGHAVARGGNDGIWLWDITRPDRPRTIANLTAHAGRINDAQFGHGGRLLAGAGEEKRVRLWNTDPDAVATDLCHSGSTLLEADEWRRQVPGDPLPELCPF